MFEVTRINAYTNIRKHSAIRIVILLVTLSLSTVIAKLLKKKETRLTYNCAHLRSSWEKKEENIWRRKIFFAEGSIN